MVILGLVLSVPQVVPAKTYVESTILCDQELTGRLDAGGNAHVYASCVTTDSNNVIIQTRREYDVTNQLTAPQRAGLLSILQNLATYAAEAQAIPTPKPTSTP